MSELRVDNIVSEDGSTAPVYSKGMTIGVGQTLNCDGDFRVGSAVSFNQGAYVTGVVTFANGIDILTPGVQFTGIVTALGGFSGNLTGTATGLSGSPNITVGSITATGNVSVAGTLTYEDVRNVDSIGIATARSGLRVTGGGLDVVGVSTFQNDISLGDNVKAKFGTGSDLQIYHDGNDSWIQDTGTGGLYLEGNNQVTLRSYGSGDTMLRANSDSSVELYHDNSKKFETTGAGVTVTGTTFTNQLSISGIATASGIGIGTIDAKSTLDVLGGDSRFGGVIETVSAATTYMSGSNLVLEMDVRQATVYTYTVPTGANIGIVSFKNMPTQSNRASGTTITCLFTQMSTTPAGTGNTTGTTGIGTNCFITGYENGASLAGISTRALVGSATTVTLSATSNDVDFVSFFVHYNGSTNTSASSYKVYVTNNNGFRQGNVGV